MKQLMTLLLFTLAMNLYGFAGGGEYDPDQKVKRTIQKALHYPDHLNDIAHKEIVLIEFLVEPCGSIQILNCNGSNSALCNWVCEKIGGLVLKKRPRQGQVMAMKISFRKES